MLKRGLFLDFIVYVLVPVFLYWSLGKKSLTESIIVVSFIATIYSIYILRKDMRVNKTFILICTGYSLYTFIRLNSINAYQAYCYDVIFLIILSLAIGILSFFKKNVAEYVYSDVLKAYNIKDLIKLRLLKKTDIKNSLRKLICILNLHLLSISFIKIWSIVIYGESRYLATFQIEICISILFMIFEIYVISKMIQFTRAFISNNMPKNNKNLNGCRVINLSEYKS